MTPEERAERHRAQVRIRVRRWRKRKRERKEAERAARAERLKQQVAIPPRLEALKSS